MVFAKSLLAVAASPARADLSFLIMGDWGGMSNPIHSTPAEHAVAKAMGEEATKLSAPFALALGDNFYMFGIRSDEYDSRFQSTFEDVFTASSLKGKDYFRVLAGNHDHYGNVTAEVAYTAHSDRWHFPALWYNFVEKVDDGTTAEFVMIDTVTLSGPSACPSTHEEWTGSDPRMQDHVDVSVADAQWQWLEKTLAASTADYLFVSGHYPVWSVCEHGPTATLVETLKPLMEKYQVSAYFAGHDHCEQHIDDGEGVQYHVVGAAHYHAHSASHKKKVPAEQLKFLDIGTLLVSSVEGGFASVEISSAGAVVNHYRASSLSGHSKKYSAPAIAPRKKLVV